jgi:hypothetical protein
MCKVPRKKTEVEGVDEEDLEMDEPEVLEEVTMEAVASMTSSMVMAANKAVIPDGKVAKEDMVVDVKYLVLIIMHCFIPYFAVIKIAIYLLFLCIFLYI